MAIQVICPGCHKRFQVSEKFGGKKGPCPSCKVEILIPKADEQVVIQEPDEFVSGGKSVSGRLDIKPITRTETKVKPVVIAAAAVAALVVFIAAIMLGKAGTLQDNLLLAAVGLLIVSPPIAVLGYTLLQNDEDLQPYRGKKLYLRALICGVVYTVLWGAFIHVAGIFMAADGELWRWLVVVPFFVGGAMGALACLDMDFANGFLHFTFFVILTVLLRWAVGLGWIWQLPELLTA